MIRILDISNRWLLGCSLGLALCVPLQSACAKGPGAPPHSGYYHPDGTYPGSDLIMDASGNLYGTTRSGGNDYPGLGTIFKVTPAGTESVLHAFTGSDGEFPFSALNADSAGNFYGTTYEGGSSGSGTVFKLAPDGTETVLYSFKPFNDGLYPLGGVTFDPAGNIYGTTWQGGGGNCNSSSADGCGTVYKLAPDGTETILHAFAGPPNDGSFPHATLSRNNVTNDLYGTTAGGGGTGCYGYGCGTVFKLAPDGTLTILHSFSGGTDGAGPVAKLIGDRQGNLYSTTVTGGNAGCFDNGPGCGTVFKIAPDGTETVLYAFKGSTDGAQPSGRLMRDEAGSLYGTTLKGGSWYCGTVFKLTQSGGVWTEHQLYYFHCLGKNPAAGLISDSSGNLYGTTLYAHNRKPGYGTVFKLAPNGKITYLYQFY